MFGAFIAFFVWVSRDLFLVGTVAATYIAFIVGTAVVLDHNSVIASPTDYAILGYRPVSSRTYFAVKLTNVLVYTTVLTTVAAWRRSDRPFCAWAGRRCGDGSTIFASSVSITLAIALGYAWSCGPSAPMIQRVLSYVQMFMSFASTAANSLSRSASRTAPSTVDARHAVGAALPGCVVRQLPRVADGQVSARYLRRRWHRLPLGPWRAARRTAVTGVLGTPRRDDCGGACQGRAVAEHPVAEVVLDGEARAVALLVRSQFRHDIGSAWACWG